MGTIQAGSSPGTRIEAGNAVLGAGTAVDTTPIANRWATFTKTHAAYVAANDSVQKAADALRLQQQKVAEADVDQDAAIDLLANALPADGLSRQNPFKSFGAPAPAVLKGMGYAKEAEQVLRLEKAVLKEKTLSQRSVDAARGAGDAARKVLTTLKPIAKFEKARTQAMAKRDAMEQAWETAFAALKRGAKAAEDDGHHGLFAALFERPVTAKKGARAKRTKPSEPAAPT